MQKLRKSTNWQKTNKIVSSYTYNDIVTFDFEKNYGPVDENQLKNAIMIKSDIPEEKADELTKVCLSYIGFNGRALDEHVTTEDRQSFLILQKLGLVTDSIETFIYDPNTEWRVSYWLFRKDRIVNASKEEKKQVLQKTTEQIYSDIPEDQWEEYFNNNEVVDSQTDISLS